MAAVEMQFNSCRFDSFMTIYLFAYRPFLKENFNEYIKNLYLLIELKKTVLILIYNPKDMIREKFWKFIDEKKYMMMI